MAVNKDIHETNWLRSVFKHGKWYVLSSLLTKGMGIIMLPIFTAYLDKGEYGVLQSLNSVARLLPIIFSFSLDAAFARFFHDAKHNKEQLTKLFSSVYWFTMLSGSLFVLIFCLSGPLWTEKLIEVKAFPYVLIAFIPSIFLQLGQLGVVFLRQSLMAKQTTMVEVIGAVLNFGLSALLIVAFNQGVLGRLWGIGLGAIFMGVFYSVYFIRSGILKPILDKKLLWTCLMFSLPLLPNIAGHWIYAMSDRLIIAGLVSVEATGLYALAAQLAQLLYFVQDAITQVTGPVAMSGLVKSRSETLVKIERLSVSLWVFMLWAVLSLFYFAKELIAILADSDYLEAYKLVPILAFSFVLQAQYRVFTGILMFHKKTWVIAMAGLIQGGVNVLLNFIFIPKFGYFFAAWSNVISMFLYTLIILFFCVRLERLKINFVNYLIPLIVFAGAILLSLPFYRNEVVSFNEIVLKVGLVIIFALGGWLFYSKKILNEK